jgi:hypothetical protein
VRLIVIFPNWIVMRVRSDCPTAPLDYTETRVREMSPRVGLYQQLRSEMSPEIHLKSIVTGLFDTGNSWSATRSDSPNDSPTKQLTQQ